MGLGDRLRRLEGKLGAPDPGPREIERRAQYRLERGYARTEEEAYRQARASLRLNPVVRIQLYEEAKRKGELELIKGGDGS